MQTPHYAPITPLSNTREIAPFELETDPLLDQDMDALEDIIGISMQNFRYAASHIVTDVGDFIDTVISGISRVSNNIVNSVSRETYQPLDIEDDFSLFIETSLNEPMDALHDIYSHVNEVQSLMGFGIMGQFGSLFLNTFERVLAFDMYSRLGRAIRGHGDNSIGVREMYVLVSSSDIDEDVSYRDSSVSSFDRLFNWFFSPKKDKSQVLKKKKIPAIPRKKKNDAFSFYVKDKKKSNDTSKISDFPNRDLDSNPLRYTYISMSDSVQFIQINRLFKDFYINRNIFEHRVNEFLQDISVLVSTYIMFVREANIHSIGVDEKALSVSLERLSLTADTLKSIGSDKVALGILGNGVSSNKKQISIDGVVSCVKEAVLNCKSIAMTILNQQEVWDLLPMVDSDGVILETGKKDVLDTLEKLNDILDHIDVLSEKSLILDVQRVSTTLKQFQYKLKLSGL